MRRVLVFSLICALAIAGAPIARAVSKAELVEAIASGSKLTKADAGRVLDATTEAIAGKLKKGDRISLVGFGSFSTSKRTASNNGCASSVDVDFSSSAAFTAKKEEGGRHTPFHNKFARIVPQRDGTIMVLGPNNGEQVSKGDEVAISARLGLAGGVLPGGSVISAAVSSVSIAAPGGGILQVESASGPAVLGVVINGAPRSAFQIGGSLQTLAPPVFDDPIGACPDDGYQGAIVSDEELLKEIIAATRLPLESVYAAYNALFDTTVSAVNAGDFVDLEGFGLFVEEQVLSATVADDPCAGLPENCPPTGSANTVYPYIDITVSVQSGAVTPSELQGLEDTLEGIAATAARTGRNPQTGKEIQIKAKKVAKFKAGADLAQTVNK
jgi:DNA-binding protein HU-beta